MMACSAPPDCAEIERRHATGIGLLIDGGASRGNLLSGEADHVILTVSRIEAERGANPGYRAFLANGFNVTRVLVLFTWEVILEWTRVAARDPPRRPAARAPWRHLSVPARDHVRLRARPARVRRDLGHDEGAARGVRDVLELRRGRTPLGARTRRHARGAAEARRAVRAHRARPSLRGPAVRDRRALGPRPDAGRDLQAAERLRAGRPRRAVARASAASPRSQTATSSRRWSGTRSTRRPATRRRGAEERRLGPAGRRARLRATSGSST